MKEELAVIIHEQDDGQVSVQLHGGLERARKSFENMKGRVQDPPTRVTLLSLDFKNNKSVVRTKNLPVREVKQEQPDGIVLGKGPIWLDKENEDGSKSDG